MEQLPKIVRERLAATARPGVHPDPDMLTAFAENSLPERERGTVLNHLAQCAECREAIAVAAPQMELELVAAAVAPAAASPVPRRPSWVRAPALRWATIAASVVVVGAAVLVYRQAAERGHVRLAASEAGLKAAPSQIVAKLEPSRKPPAPSAVAAQHAAGDERREDEVGGLTAAAGPASAAKGIPPPLVSRDLAASADSAAAGLPARPGAKRPLPENQQQSANALIAGNVGTVGTAQSLSSNSPAQKLTDELKQNELKKDELQKDKSAALSKELQLSPAAPAPPVEEAGAASPVASAPAPAQTVAVEAPAAKPEAATAARAKTAAGGAVATGSFAGIAQYGKRQSLDTTGTSSNVVTPQWVLSKDGSMLIRSNDGGKTWQTITVASHVVLLSVDAFGPEIWAGGGGGALYHSVDEGAHWEQVKPAAEGKPLSDDVTRIHFNDAQHGQLTTLHHQIWITADGGKTWQLQ